MRIRYLSLYICIVFSCAVQAQNYRRMATEAVERKDYVEAAMLWKKYGNDIAEGKTLETLEENELDNYLTALRSEANCLYMVDDYKSLPPIIGEYEKLLNGNAKEMIIREYGDEGQLMLRHLQHHADKLWGSYYYGMIDDSLGYADMAELAYKKALAEVDIHNVHDLNVLYRELAQLYYKNELYGNAVDMLEKVKPSASDNPNMIRSQIAMCLARNGQNEPDDMKAETLLRQALDSIDKTIDNLEKDETDYFESLRKRGKIMMIYGDRMNQDLRTKANDDYSKYVEFQKTNVARTMRNMTDGQMEQYWLSIHRFLFDCFRIGEANPEMLYDLALFARGYLVESKGRQDVENVSWTDVKRNLKVGEAAIEFVVYTGKNDDKFIAALVLKHNSIKPQFVYVSSVNELNKTVLNGSDMTLENAVNEDNPFAKNLIYDDSALSHKIWTPELMNVIGDANDVYFTPDGIVNQLAVEYMMPDSNKNCYRLSSTKRLIGRKNKSYLNNALIVGDIDYYSNVCPNSMGNDVEAYKLLSSKNLFVTSLNVSRQEMDSVKNVFGSANCHWLEKDDATDEEFVRQAPEYDVLHVSTHGLFAGKINPGTELRPTLANKAMSESVIIFAGAAHNLNDRDFNPEKMDGILSAEELSKLDLRNVELVVLSACQTGLGHNTEDGVYGIIRALKQAGAKTLIVSLWSVDETATALFMNLFYKNLADKGNVHEAFYGARDNLMQFRKENKRFNARSLSRLNQTISYEQPYYFNPFIIIDPI